MLFDLLVNFWWFYSVINSEYNVDSVHLSWRFRRFDDVTDTSDVTIERHVLLLIKPLCAVARGHFLSRFCPRHISSAKIRYHTLKATLSSHFGGSGGIHYFYRGSSDRTPVSIEAPQAWRIHKQSRKTPSSNVFETAQGIRQQVWLLEGLQDRQMTREQQMTHSSCQSWENLKQSENKMQRHQTQNWEANFRNCLQ